jgi:hypothetical protein
MRKKKMTQNLLINPTYFSKAQFAVVGSFEELGSGIISWHEFELDAYKTCKNINKNGGIVRVERTPKGNIEHIRQEILDLVLNA